MSHQSPLCYGYIYRTTHLPSGDTYIGQHRPKPREPWPSYLGSGLRITRLLRHHPREAFQKELLAEASTQEELDTLEKHHIQEERAQGRATLNIADGGRGVGSEALQALWTPELRERQRATLKRLWQEPEHRAKLLEASRRYHATEASGKAQAQSMARLWRDPAFAARAREYLHGQETKLRRQLTLQEVKRTPEGRVRAAQAARQTLHRLHEAGRKPPLRTCQDCLASGLTTPLTPQEEAAILEQVTAGTSPKKKIAQAHQLSLHELGKILARAKDAQP